MTGLPFTLLCVMLLTLWVAGGASRPDVAGQVVVRSVSALLLAGIILFGDRPDFARAKVIWLLMAAAVALPLLQLLPLWPGAWADLPGRAVIVEAATVTSQPQPWRPLSMSPGLTGNAAASLIVPLVTMVIATQLDSTARLRSVSALLASILAATFLGLLQFSSRGIDNPLINEAPGLVSGNFANRNHFALLLALGCVLAPAWAVLDGRRLGWRGPVALGLVLLFLLTILASGSRAGLILGPIGLVIGLMLAWRGIGKELRRFSRWVFPTLIVGLVATITIFVAISLAAGRAESINRLIAIDLGQDMRGRALPTVLSMISTYFPAGTGLGSFDPLFRMHEPFALLKPTYFNHAHNDFLEVVLDAGLPGLMLLLAALAWWAWASIRVWRTGSASQPILQRLGSAIILLVVLASIFDYPARTPMIMAVIVLAGVWLAGDPPAPRRSSLP